MPTQTKALPCLPLLFLSACNFGLYDCDHIPYAEERSGQFTASLVSVNCGATAPETSWLILRGADEQTAGDPFAVFEGRTVSLKWEGDQKLEVEMGEAELVRGARRWGQTSVVYLKDGVEAADTLPKS